MLADYHMHTSFSEDSNYPMEDCIKRAIELKFDEICFTEHTDYGCITSYCCDREAYYKKFLECKQKYSDKISLKFGMEFGVQAHHAGYFNDVFRQYPFDFILLSFHQIEDKELWNNDFQFGKTQSEYNRIYYEEIYNTVKIYNNYSVLAHMDLMRRYDKNGEYPFKNNKELIEQILKYIISKEKGIEVNTSSFRYNLNDLMPSVDILKLYRELGGEIITVGSDSHKESQVGDHILYIHEVLKSLGYKFFSTFNGMKPIFHKL